MICDGRDDADEFRRIRAALKILAFSEKDCWEIFKLLAAILHMGNVDFEGYDCSLYNCMEVQYSSMNHSVVYHHHTVVVICLNFSVGTMMNNMDSCDVLSSSHFSITAKLLEVKTNVTTMLC